MDDQNMHTYGDHYPDDSEVPGAHPPPDHPLSRLATRLGELLDEDQWAECETLLLQGWQRDTFDRKTGADWRQNSSLEIWFPFAAEELAQWKRAAEANIDENVRLRADLDEAVEILDTYVGNVQTYGNYSKETTLVFLGQVRQCLRSGERHEP